jgi:hypothetical protein
VRLPPNKKYEPLQPLFQKRPRKKINKKNFIQGKRVKIKQQKVYQQSVNLQRPKQKSSSKLKLQSIYANTLKLQRKEKSPPSISISQSQNFFGGELSPQAQLGQKRSLLMKKNHFAVQLNSLTLLQRCKSAAKSFANDIIKRNTRFQRIMKKIPHRSEVAKRKRSKMHIYQSFDDARQREYQKMQAQAKSMT